MADDVIFIYGRDDQEDLLEAGLSNVQRNQDKCLKYKKDIYIWNS